MAFVFVLVAVCTVTTVGLSENNMSEAFAETSVSNDLFVVNYTDKSIEILVNGDARELLNGNKADLTQLKNTLISAMHSIFVESILNTKNDLQMASEVSIPEDFDWSNVSQISQFKDYIVDRLSDPQEFQNYVDGKYDILIDYAIGIYVENNTDYDVEESYSKIQSAIQDVVDQAYEVAVENAKADLGEYFDETEWEQKKVDAANKVVESVDKVQTNSGKVTISLKELVGSISGLAINGDKVYTTANGISINAVKKIANTLPAPSKIANMSDDAFRTLVDWNIDVDTTFGTVSFNAKFGMFGNLSPIRKAAKAVADHVALSVDGNDVLLVMNVPALMSKVLEKGYESSHFTAEQKNFVFDLFNSSITDYTVDEVVELLKGVDYKYWLSNVYNVEYMNRYFGSVVSSVIGHEFTETTIDTLVTKALNFISPKMQTVEGMTVKEAKNWLASNIPGASHIPDSLAQALINVANKFDWASYDAEYVREIVTGDSYDLNSELVSLFDRFENSEKMYDTVVRYFEKAVNFLPEFAKNATIIEHFDGEKFVVDGSYTVNVDNILNRVSSFVSRHGYESIAKYISNMSVLLDKTSYTVDLSATVIVPNLYKVDYEVEGTTIKSGFLPKGVNGAEVYALSGIEMVEDYEILYWVDKATGEKVDEMPAQNITLTPYYEVPQKDFEVELTESINVTYDKEKEYKLNVSVVGPEEFTYTYAWYKDGALLENTSTSLTVKTVADSGVYSVVVTNVETETSKTTNTVDVVIAKKIINAPSEWNKTYTFTYGDTVKVRYVIEENADLFSIVRHTFFDANGNYIDVTADDFAWNAGSYGVKANFKLKNENYVSSDSKTSWEMNATIVIEKKGLNVIKASWSIDGDVYDGNAKTFALSLDNTSLTETEKQLVIDNVSYTLNDTVINDMSVVEVGTYVVKAELPTEYENYVIVNKISNFTFSIKPATMAVAIDWGYTTPYTFNGNAQGLTVEVSVTSDVATFDEGCYGYSVAGVSSSTDAGTYVAYVMLQSKNKNFAFETTAYTQEWVINAMAVAAPAMWDAEISYTFGDKVNPKYELANPEYFTAITYTYAQDGNAIDPTADGFVWNADSYTVVANFSLINNNYVIDGSEQRTFALANDMTIAPKSLDLSGAAWSYPTNAIYDGEAKVVSLNLKNTLLTPAEKAIVRNNLVYKVDGNEVTHPIELYNAGTYQISAEMATTNYIATAPALEFIIAPATVNVLVEWNYKAPLTYNGSEQSISAKVKVLFKGNEIDANNYTVTMSGYKATIPGNYTATLKVVVNASNFKLVGNGEFTKEWTILARAVETWEEGKVFEDTTGIKVEIKDGNLPKDYVFVVKEENLTNAQKEQIAKVFKDQNVEIANVYDIHFENAANVEKKVNGKFKVTLPIPEEYLNSEKLAVIHIADNGKTTIVVGAVRNGNNMEFETNGFSLFAVVSLSDTVTPIWPLIITIIVLAVLLILCIIIIIYLLKHKNKGKDGNSDEEAPVEEEPVEEAPVEEAPVEETSVEDTPVEEEPVEEAPMDETPVEEPAEDTSVEETPVVVAPIVEVAPITPIAVEPEMVEMLERSFTARITQSEDQLKATYSELKNYALSFKGVRSRISWNYDSINKGRNKVCKIVVKGKSLLVYIALDPDTLPEKYHHKSAKGITKYEATPTMLRVRSPRSLKYAKDLIAMVMSELAVKQGPVGTENFTVDYKTDDQLLSEGLIKTKLVKARKSPWKK